MSKLWSDLLTMDNICKKCHSTTTRKQIKTMSKGCFQIICNSCKMDERNCICELEY